MELKRADKFIFSLLFPTAFHLHTLHSYFTEVASHHQLVIKVLSVLHLLIINEKIHLKDSQFLYTLSNVLKGLKLMCHYDKVQVNRYIKINK